MARRQKEIFAHENKYTGNIFKRFGRWFSKWFGNLKKWQKILLIVVLVLLIVSIAVGGYVFSKLDKMNRVTLDERKLSCVDVDGYVNILLLGVDTRDMSNIDGAGADAIMILSIKEETGEVKLMSVYRDTYLKIGDMEYYDKITNANRVGGPELMIQSLNQAMDLNISKFAVVNFQSVADLVDAVGGITVNVEDYEIEQLNKYTIQTANNIGKTEYQLVEAPGEQTLEGVQAVSYGRIRKGVGDDYKRTERMRIVISKVLDKVKVMSVSELNRLVNLMMPQVQTNLSNNDILGLAARVMNFNISSGAGWPYNVSSGLLGGVSYVFADDLYTNTKELHQKMFGQEDYEPSELVLTMSNAIEAQKASEVTNKKKIETKKEDDKDDDKKDKEESSSKDKNQAEQSTDSGDTTDEGTVEDTGEGETTAPEEDTTDEGTGESTEEGAGTEEGAETETPETPEVPEETPETPEVPEETPETPEVPEEEGTPEEEPAE